MAYEREMSNGLCILYVLDAGLSASDIKCMGITTQSNTFITWDKSVFMVFAE